MKTTQNFTKKQNEIIEETLAFLKKAEAKYRELKLPDGKFPDKTAMIIGLIVDQGESTQVQTSYCGRMPDLIFTNAIINEGVQERLRSAYD